MTTTEHPDSHFASFPTSFGPVVGAALRFMRSINNSVDENKKRRDTLEAKQRVFQNCDSLSRFLLSIQFQVLIVSVDTQQ